MGQKVKAEMWWDVQKPRSPRDCQQPEEAGRGPEENSS